MKAVWRTREADLVSAARLVAACKVSPQISTECVLNRVNKPYCTLNTFTIMRIFYVEYVSCMRNIPFTTSSIGDLCDL